MKSNIIECIAIIIACILCCLFVGRTTINGIFPFIHIEYPWRSVVLLIWCIIGSFILSAIKA